MPREPRSEAKQGGIASEIALWDGSPITLGGWLSTTLADLFNENNNYYNLMIKGHVVYKATAYFPTKKLAFLQAAGTLAKGTFDNGTIVPIALNQGNVDPKVLDAWVVPDGVKISTTMWEDVDGPLASAIVARIQDTAEGQNLLNKSKRSAFQIVIHCKTVITKMTPAERLVITNRIDDIIKRGLARVSISEFNLVKNTVYSLNLSLTKPADELDILLRLELMIHGMSGSISSELTSKITTEEGVARANGTVITTSERLEAIKAVIQSNEARALNNESPAARANRAGVPVDPNKDGRPGGQPTGDVPRTINEWHSAMRKCHNCVDSPCGQPPGCHLDKDCPKFKAAAKKAKKAAKKALRASAGNQQESKDQAGQDTTGRSLMAEAQATQNGIDISSLASLKEDATAEEVLAHVRAQHGRALVAGACSEIDSESDDDDDEADDGKAASSDKKAEAPASETARDGWYVVVGGPDEGIYNEPTVGADQRLRPLATCAGSVIYGPASGIDSLGSAKLALKGALQGVAPGAPEWPPVQAPVSMGWQSPVPMGSPVETPTPKRVPSEVPTPTMEELSEACSMESFRQYVKNSPVAGVRNVKVYSGPGRSRVHILAEIRSAEQAIGLKTPQPPDSLEAQVQARVEAELRRHGMAAASPPASAPTPSRMPSAIAKNRDQVMALDHQDEWRQSEETELKAREEEASSDDDAGSTPILTVAPGDPPVPIELRNYQHAMRIKARESFESVLQLAVPSHALGHDNRSICLINNLVPDITVSRGRKFLLRNSRDASGNKIILARSVHANVATYIRVHIGDREFEDLRDTHPSDVFDDELTTSIDEFRESLHAISNLIVGNNSVNNDVLISTIASVIVNDLCEVYMSHKVALKNKEDEQTTARLLAAAKMDSGCTHTPMEVDGAEPGRAHQSSSGCKHLMFGMALGIGAVVLAPTLSNVHLSLPTISFSPPVNQHSKYFDRRQAIEPTNGQSAPPPLQSMLDAAGHAGEHLGMALPLIICSYLLMMTLLLSARRTQARITSLAKSARAWAAGTSLNNPAPRATSRSSSPCAVIHLVCWHRLLAAWIASCRRCHILLSIQYGTALTLGTMLAPITRALDIMPVHMSTALHASDEPCSPAIRRVRLAAWSISRRAKWLALLVTLFFLSPPAAPEMVVMRPAGRNPEAELVSMSSTGGQQVRRQQHSSTTLRHRKIDANIATHMTTTMLKGTARAMYDVIQDGTIRPETITSTGRALLSPAQRTPSSTEEIRQNFIELVLDSGCTWHGHHDKRDLINYRPLSEVIEGIAKSKCRVVGIGDLPILAKDSHGQLHHLVIKDVRHVPKFNDTLISVAQLWEQSETDVRFRNIQQVQLAERNGHMATSFPFRHNQGLYIWSVRRGERIHDTSRVLTSKAHSPHATEHISRLPDAVVSQVMHRRLHLPHNKLRGLHKSTKDSPKISGNTFDLPCSACTEAAAVSQPHKASRYQPSYVGRQVHGDIVGPFIKSAVGHYQYALIIVDDHSRYKHVYFLRTRDEAPTRIQRYVAEVNAVASAKAGKPVQVVGHFNSDNAGEFLSQSFTEFLDKSLIKHTTCPPYVHQLNGVAERAIRSVMDLARTDLAASNAPKSFWPYAIRHAVDILNRTTGPPVGAASSHEIVTGQLPTVMDIMPFGCRSFALKPRDLLKKSQLEFPSHVGIHLGKDELSPGSFLTWVPAWNKVVTSSDTSFDESLFPWRPENDRRVGPVMPTVAPIYQPKAITRSIAPEKPTKVAEAESLTSAFDSITRSPQATARDSNKVLILFSGKYNRPDGIAAFLKPLGIDCVQVDNDPKDGDSSHDLLNDQFYQTLLKQVKAGHYCAIFAAPPCSTFSVARFLDKPDSPPPVRDRKHIMMLPNLPPAYQLEAKRANALTARTCELLMEGSKVGTQFILENPADHGDASQHSTYLDERHCPMWLFPSVKLLIEVTRAKMVTFPMCAFGAAWRKETTLMYSDGFENWMVELDKMRCTHGRHDPIVGKDNGDDWKSKQAAAYPPDFNFYVARAIAAAQGVYKSPIESEIEPQVVDQPTITAVVEPTPPASPPPKPVNTVPDGARIEILYAPDGSYHPATISDFRITGTHREHQVTWDDSDDVKWSEKPQWLRLSTETWRPLSETIAPPAKSVAPKPVPVAGATQRRTRSQTHPVRGLVALLCTLPIISARLAQPAADDPKNRDQAMAMDRDGWFLSEETELKNHETNGSWKHVDRSVWRRTKRKLVKMVWVYKIKRNGSLKSRLCVQGCSQIPGVDYDQTFCAAMRPGSMRLLAAIAATHQLRMHRYDFKAAYLQGDLLDGEVVYCQPPAGYREHGRSQTGSDGEEQVLCVQRPIYGMAQAGRRWQRSLFPWLISQGFTQHHADSCVFSRMHKGQRLFVGVYVDDLCVCHGTSPDALDNYNRFITSLNSRWEVDDEGEITDLLGVEFEFKNGNVTLHQNQYIQKMVKEHLSDGAPSNLQSYRVPCDALLPLTVANALSDDSTRDPDLVKRYQSLVGALLYCSVNTRPDIAFAVNMLCRAMAKPTSELFGAAEHVLLYLYRSRALGLTYAASSVPLTGYSDSDWGTQHSISGWTFQMARATISWGSKRQTSVALSSCEAEIMAASEAAKEAVYLDRFLSELGEPRAGPIPLHVDNTGARNLAYNPELHQRTKHIDRRHFFVREMVEALHITVPYVNTADNLADFFTKPLAPRVFLAMRDRIMNIPHVDSGGAADKQSLWGGVEPHRGDDA